MTARRKFGTKAKSMALVAMAAIVMAVSIGVPASAQGSKPPYHVPYTFLANIIAAPTGPNTPPPGANNWSCKPSAAHPEPVILVHGLFANMTDNWQTFGPLLANNGYCVYTITYGNHTNYPPPFNFLGGLAPMEQSALQLGAFVDKVLAATGASKVDLVGHSEGATMPYWYLKFDGGAAKVDKMVGISSVVHGTSLVDPTKIAGVLPPLGGTAALAAGSAGFCDSCAEFSPTSSFIKSLDAFGVTVPGVTYTQIVTKFDELVLPYTSGIIDESNVTNIVVQNQCPLDFADHIAIASDPVAARDVLNALDPAHAQRVPCTLVLPAIG